MADTDTTELAAMVSGIAAGDQQAWRALIQRYTPLVWAIARAYRLTPSEAEDVSQTVWMRLSEHIGSLRDPTQLPAWLATTARREALLAARRRARTHDLDTVGIAYIAEEVPDTSPTPDEVVETGELEAALSRAFGQLHSRCQTILSLFLTEPRLSYAEIAAALNMPVGAIGPSRQRCLAQLRRLLAQGVGMTETELLDTLRSSKLGAGEIPARVIDKANDALTARPAERERSTPDPQPTMPSPRIFISYRSGDEAATASLLHRELFRHFGEDNVFIDSSIPPGHDFERESLSRVRRSDVLLAIIGPRWLTASHPTGGRAIEHEEDRVRRELAEAFANDVRVVPVLVNDTARLTDAVLPDNIAPLAKCQYLTLRHRTIEQDLKRIVDQLVHFFLKGRPVR